MTEKRIKVLLTSNALFNVLLLTVGIFLSSSFFWGFNLISFFGFWQRLVLLITGFIIFIPQVRGYIYKFIDETSKKFDPKYLPVLILFLYTVFFLIFRIRVHFLGDGPMILRMLPEMHGVTDMIATNEPGSYAMDLFVQDILRKLFIGSYSPEYVYIFLSYISGIAFIFISIKFIRSLNIDSAAGIFFFILLFFTSGTIFFLGYVETYQLVFAIALFYIVYSIQFFNDKLRTSYIISAVFGFWLSFHYLASVFIPSYLVVLIFHFKKDRFQAIISLLVFVLCFMLGYLFTGLDINELTKRFMEPNVSHWLPLFSADKTEIIPALSPEHLWDVFNSQFLVLPFGIFTLIGIMILFRNKINWKDYPVIFLSTMCIFSIIFIFFFNSLLGASRDWDVIMLMSFPFLFFNIYLLYKYFDLHIIRKSVVLISYLAFWQSMIWILLNSNSAVSEKRNTGLENDILWDKYKAALYYEEMCAYYKSKTDYDQAMENYYKSFNIKPSTERLVLNLSNMYQKLGKFKDADTLLQGFIVRTGFNRDAYLSQGIVKMSEGDYINSVRCFRNILEKDQMDRDALGNIAGAMYLLKEYDSSIVYSKKVIALNPYDPKPYLGLGDCYIALHDTVQALKNYKYAKELDKDGKLRNEIEMRIGGIKKFSPP